MRKHLVQMMVAGGAVLVALALFGVPVSRALPYALLLACPVMMLAMMGGMNHGGGKKSAGCGHDHSSDASPAEEGSAHRPAGSAG